ncbi:glycosyltransferase family 4 protein [Streptomyces sp. NPDC001985]|uniref:glycosyltransferase family 4 protein n=1 Tax=Streptomyces sp. NPDC001985 TaxID=3154406 RepID=UPI003322EA0B
MPVRVLMLAPAYHPMIGGAESYARCVTTGLAQRGHDIMVVTDGDRVTAPEKDTDGGARVERISGYLDLLSDPTKLRWEQMQFSTTGELAEVIERWGVPDIVFANSHETAVLGSMVALAHHVPLVANFHEQEPERGPLGTGRARLVYQHLPLAALIAGSRFYYDKAVDHGSPASSTHLLHHGIDCDLFANDGFRAPDGRFVMTLSGRIAPRKQQDLMVRVLAGLVGRGIDAHVVIAGRAHSSQRRYYEDLLELIEESGMSERVDVRQELGLHDMPQVYRDSDVVVQPSVAEGLGLAVLEAMAAGRPVVVSETTGLREVVREQHTGIRLPPGDEEGWTEVLEQLARDVDLRAKYAANALTWVRREFTIDRMLSQTERLLESVRDSWSHRPDQEPELG